ncbi:MAG: DUF4838 domain-containing protein [Firmicutes bacterium]|nr:DUF4838 domain-containing protein [Bacillota bacterium]
MEIRLMNPSETSPVILFAKEELTRYLTRMGAPAIRLLIGRADLAVYGFEKVADPSLDDQYLIDVEPDGGIILGGNDRSVLLGAYRYLTMIGCAFLRPGLAHEVVPVKLSPSDYRAKERFTASLRHRGVCLEGADSVENILDFIDWSPKVGYNSFFLQFEYPQTFLERYYSHQKNPLLPPVDWKMADSVRLMPYLSEAMEKRGILQHRVGHGWTSKVLGCEATGWDTEEKEFDEVTRSLIAKVGGKRELYYGVPTNTNLCLSNPEARARYAAAVVDYVSKNPATDYLHLWLADGSHNSCECEACNALRNGKQPRPSDHYIDLLNDVDAALTAAGLDVKLVMLMYVDLLWPPIVSHLNNPGRFVLMFAPIYRTFEHAFDEVQSLPEEIPLELNKTPFPKDLPNNLTLLKGWQEATGGSDCFDYDYYMGRAHYGDPTYINLSRIIVRDLKDAKRLKMNGINSCQELRAHFPNGLAGYVMARVSADTSLTYEALAAEYYEACYGASGKDVLAVMEKLSDCFHIDYVLHQRPWIDPEYHAQLENVSGLLDELTELYADHTPVSSEAQQHMWEELLFFTLYTDLYTQILLHLTAGEDAEAIDLFDHDFTDLVTRHEMVDQSGLDVFRVLSVFGSAVKHDPRFLGATLNQAT